MSLIFSLKNVSKSYKASPFLSQSSYAVKNISFDIFEGESLGLVGESGSGKSTIGKLMTQLIKPTVGEISYNNTPFSSTAFSLNTFRREVQIIFQDPFSSLNPRLTVAQMLGEVLTVHHIVDKSGLEAEISRLLDLVGLNPKYKQRYPHEFSGGQRQRLVIARAMAVKPQFIVCDEAISALDVSIQAQILNLLIDLQKMHRLTYLFISHSLSAVQFISQRVAVLYKGEIVEIGDTDRVFKEPKDEYTKSLLKFSLLV